MRLGATSKVGPWRAEADTLARAFAGAFLFGMPLLFTMEMWWIGEHLGRLRLGTFVVLGLLVNVGLAYYTGFRNAPRTLPHALKQGIEALAIGAVAGLVSLFALGQLARDGSPDGMLGMVIIQAIPLSMGASVANIVFSGGNARSLGGSGSSAGGALLNDILATAAGALFLGFAIAPTEEIPMLAGGLQGAFLIATVALTLVISYLIVFASGFDPEERGAGTTDGLFQHPFSETVLAYLVALFVSAALLVGFGQIGTSEPLLASLTKIIVLAVPASIGGAAGRLVV
jgi:putative integral membrane protein (TIGR02587 family)